MYSIETRQLTKKFKEKVAVDGINLQIKKGELFALLGTNGAGKTTTIKMLSGLILPTFGDIEIENMDMKKDIFKIKEILNLPENLDITYLLALGIPDQKAEAFDIKDSIKYYHDENQNVFVPKRKLEDVII